MFIDEKQDDFLVLAVGEEEGRFYAFNYQGKIICVEDIPTNYPRMGVFTVKGLKGVVKDLKQRGWEIVIDHVTAKQ